MMKPTRYGGRVRRAARTAVLSMLLAALLCGAFSALAATEAPYNGYYYDQWGDARPAPNGYIPVKSVGASDIGVSRFGTVNDLAADASGRFYLLDSDNSVIYQMDRDLNLLRTIAVTKDGNAVSFSGAGGMTVGESGGALRLYIADTVNQRVLVTDEGGTLLHDFGKPETDMLEEDQAFSPIKLAVTEDGSMFVLCQQMYDGAIMMDSSGSFLGFFGSNKVEVSASMLSDYFWKNLLGEKMRDKFARYVPREYTNLTIDEQGFVYTTTLVTSESSTQIRRLNWKSLNVLPSESFGDSNNSYGENKFIDIASMGGGIFAALDTNKGRVFLYGNDGEGVTILGGNGTQDGTFRTPVALEAIEDRLYVYDQSTQKITMLEPTGYGKDLLAASRLFLIGDYEQSDTLWQGILRQNNGYEKAYISIGRNLMENQEYAQALTYFRRGGARSDYSDAFEQLRSVHLRKWFPLYAGAFAVLLALALFLLRDKGSYKKEDRADPVTFSGRLRYAMFHPVKGTRQLVCGHTRMNTATPVIVLAAFLTSILQYQFTGFAFNTNEPGKMDLLVLFVSIVGLFGVAVLSNWLVITMADGKGRLNEIANVVALAMIPAVGAELLRIALSNVLINNEAMFLHILAVLGYGWGLVLLLIGLAQIHQFTFGRNLVMSLLTVVAALILLILVLLCFSIEKQVEIFFSSLFNELKMIV